MARKFVWINALTRQPILDEDANEIVTAIKPKNEERKIAKLIGRLTIDLSDSNNQLQQIKYSESDKSCEKDRWVAQNYQIYHSER